MVGGLYVDKPCTGIDILSEFRDINANLSGHLNRFEKLWNVSQGIDYLCNVHIIISFPWFIF